MISAKTGDLVEERRNRMRHAAGLSEYGGSPRQVVATHQAVDCNLMAGGKAA
jgi:hypothetical protein